MMIDNITLELLLVIEKIQWFGRFERQQVDPKQPVNFPPPAEARRRGGR
jgi:hypothetical protein